MLKSFTESAAHQYSEWHPSAKSYLDLLDNYFFSSFLQQQLALA
jgi:hypothetical protein